MHPPQAGCTLTGSAFMPRNTRESIHSGGPPSSSMER